VKVLAVQNVECETLGSLEKMLRSDGYEIEVVDAQADHVPQGFTEYSGFVILGGPMAVYDNLGYLEKEQNLIRAAIKADIPLLGICLGSQLIAQAAGGRVFKGSRKEIGWHDIQLTPSGRSDIFRGIDKDNPVGVFQWHGDTYELPASAKILAESELYPQAFRIGSAIGIQFHPEVDRQMIKRWSREYSNELQAERLVPDSLLPNRNQQGNLESMCRVVYRNFSVAMEKPRRS
jgi:GMP synthase (glutamine-hydrolysing)